MTELAEWPKTYHPASYDENSEYVIDLTLTAEGFQLRPDTWVALSSWCGGVRTLDGNGNQALQIGGELARLGDFVMRQDGVLRVEPADGHYQRWSPQ